MQILLIGKWLIKLHRDFLNPLSRTEDKEKEDVACGLVKICLYYG